MIHVATISPPDRVRLDSLIEQERMIALDPPFERPDWAYTLFGFSWMPIAFVMDATGTVSPRWIMADEITWSNVVAVRFETPGGIPINIEAFEDDGEYC
jgi:hypothetical protein